MPATSEASHKSRTTGTRLPRTPSVISSRRGGHAPLRSRAAQRQAGAPATPAIHLTPDVVIAPRGTLSVENKGRAFARARDAGALDMRRLRN
jgi:hypothetical protein